MEIAYTALTETCTLLLDGEGICRSVLAASSAAVANGQNSRPSRIPATAERCIGAQYVATLDIREPGGMTPLPKPGSQMLFARTETNGRVMLIRTAKVVRFEHIPARQSGVHERPEVVDYGDDDELTIAEAEPPTLVADRRKSSLPPPPPRTSGVVPTAERVDRTAIPPPPPTPYGEANDFESTTLPRYTPPPPARATLPSADGHRASLPSPGGHRASLPSTGGARASLPSADGYRPSLASTTGGYRASLPSTGGYRVVRTSDTPSTPRRPSLVRVSTPDLEDLSTRPFLRDSDVSTRPFLRDSDVSTRPFRRAAR